MQKLNSVRQETEGEGPCCYRGSEMQLVGFVYSQQRGERDNIFGGLEAGNKEGEMAERE